MASTRQSLKPSFGFERNSARASWTTSAQASIYQRLRFVRILGTTHVLWVPMLTWMALRLDTVPAGAFRVWLTVLIATNAVSLTIDAWDAVRFALGERHPYYVW